MQEPCPQLAAVVVEPQRVFEERAVLGLGATLHFGDHRNFEDFWGSTWTFKRSPTAAAAASISFYGFSTFAWFDFVAELTVSEMGNQNPPTHPPSCLGAASDVSHHGWDDDENIRRPPSDELSECEWLSALTTKSCSQFT
jgi:hypothetical protein